METLELNNKYYTPDISEFHVGFEYDNFDCLGDGNRFWQENKKWWQTIDNKDTSYIKESCLMSYKDLQEAIKNEEVRVKYLDKEDIESLGFKYDVNESGEEHPCLYETHGYSSAYYIDRQNTESRTAYLLFHFPDNFVIIDSIVDCGQGREEMLFRGFIKNKSELKVLLKQLGINE
jgi:hypothetical protein